jgi:DNA polymerase-4
MRTSTPLCVGRTALSTPACAAGPIAVSGGVVLCGTHAARAWRTKRHAWTTRGNSVPTSFCRRHFDDTQRLVTPPSNAKRFTPSIERISIDEAFADVAGCTHLFGSPAEIARTVRARVRPVGLPISIGVARKHLAKIVSQVADALVADRYRTRLFMWGCLSR